MPPTRRRRLGAFYTPDAVAVALTDWAVGDRPGPILDPSFGGCSFLRAALQVLVARGVAGAGDLIFGVDIDRTALRHARNLYLEGVPRDHIAVADFLAVDPASYAPFAAIVGNPPYVRHHWLSRIGRKNAWALPEKLRLSIPKTSSAWVYFVLHAMRFLRKGGRLAMVLPGSILHAAYAAPVLRHIESSFASVRLVHIHERMFDAEEESVVLLGDGYGTGSASAALIQLNTIDSLPQVLSREQGGHDASAVSAWKSALLAAPCREVWQNLLGRRSVVRLSEVATLRIGVVTGANSFFVRTVEDVRRLRQDGLSTAAILSRSHALQGASWTAADQKNAQRSGKRSRLLMIRPSAKPRGSLKREVDLAAANGIDGRHHCARRSPWFALADRRPPDAFLPYMSEHQPRLVLNEARATCTNAVHRVTWKRECAAEETAIAASSWTSLFGLGAELFGKSYGGGVLKLEIGLAAKLPVLRGDVPSALLRRLDELARAGRRAEAHALADKEILQRRLKLTAADVSLLRNGIAVLRARRNAPEC